jgi:hypothetical protein
MRRSFSHFSIVCARALGLGSSAIQTLLGVALRCVAKHGTIGKKKKAPPGVRGEQWRGRAIAPWDSGGYGATKASHIVSCCWDHD